MGRKLFKFKRLEGAAAPGVDPVALTPVLAGDLWKIRDLNLLPMVEEPPVFKALVETAFEEWARTRGVVFLAAAIKAEVEVVNV